ncbi:transcription termination factor NusA [Candidatus Nanosynbacter sp. HMT-352]|uniref:transcription termination factor NusA n=1 Tax=Candidatus Nanosynbacter sp. HMT-352 TaxID=2899133 RepID=UPI001FB5885B|nr:transcription termination factor NusA [Candidatus Nanosynbacter sp. HMT-352]UOG66245.1 transcription termination factor NusA [Candidatus Nanosynbacter sp. HMT-352]
MRKYSSGRQVGVFRLWKFETEKDIINKKENVMEDLNIKQLTLAVRTIAEEKNLPEETVLSVIEQAIAAAWRRDNGTRDQLVRASLNINNGTAVVSVVKTVVEEVENDANQIDLEEAKEIDPAAELGGEVVMETHNVTTFGRVAAQTAKQVILQRLREAEREVVLAEFEDKIGTVVIGTVQRVEPRVVRIELGKAVGIMPQSEQITGEYYGVGRRIKVYIKDIEREGRGPQLILSRGNEEFVRFLFNQEVPEMETGAVEIKAIAREAGRRTKLAVSSALPGVDPVGTFVGGHGARVQAVMNEIGEQEKIDIIPYEEDAAGFIANAMSPAEVLSVTVNEDEKRATVYVSEDQQSIAIGRAGQNVRLASRLTGYELDIEAKAPIKAEPKPRKNIEDSLMSVVEEVAE